MTKANNLIAVPSPSITLCMFPKKRRLSKKRKRWPEVKRQRWRSNMIEEGGSKTRDQILNTKRMNRNWVCATKIEPKRKRKRNYSDATSIIQLNGFWFLQTFEVVVFFSVAALCVRCRMCHSCQCFTLHQINRTDYVIFNLSSRNLWLFYYYNKPIQFVMAFRWIYSSIFDFVFAIRCFDI